MTNVLLLEGLLWQNWAPFNCWYEITEKFHINGPRNRAMKHCWQHFGYHVFASFTKQTKHLHLLQLGKLLTLFYFLSQICRNPIRGLLMSLLFARHMNWPLLLCRNKTLSVRFLLPFLAANVTRTKTAWFPTSFLIPTIRWKQLSALTMSFRKNEPDSDSRELQFFSRYCFLLFDKLSL